VSRLSLALVLAGLAATALLLPPRSVLPLPAAAAEEPAKKADKKPNLHPDPPQPLPSAKLEASIHKGIAFLLKDQNEDGSWGSPTRTKGLNIYAPVPGAHHAFRAAVTALCVMALIEVDDGTEAVRKAVEKGEDYLFGYLPKVRRAEPTAIYNVWAHGYGIQALAAMHGRLPNDKERQRKIERMIREQYDYLTRYESVEGGWGYYDFGAGTQRPNSMSASFVDGAILIAFDRAKKIGVPPPEKLTRRAIDNLQMQRKPDFTYLYGLYTRWEPMWDINRPGGSLGRSQCCNLALRLWGEKRVTDAVLTEWLDRLITRQGWLDMGRKRPIPHESHFAVAGYFYYFGHYYASLCIGQLPAAERPFYQDHLGHILLDRQEADGSWWDYPLYNYHQQWGTAMALMSLKHCRKPAAPDKVQPPPAPRPGPAVPLPKGKLESSIRRGVRHLLGHQNKDGSWGSPRWNGGVDVDPVPGAHHSFTTATTALCVEALLDAGGDDPEARQALARAEAFLLDNLPRLRRADQGNLPNIWGHTYGIQVLARLHGLCPDDPARRRRLEAMIREQVAFLQRFETVHGGWFYYAAGLQRPLAPAASFVNAAVLIAFDRARRIGIELPEKVVARAVQSLAAQRKPDSSYLYSADSPLDMGGAVYSINQPPGSLGRSQACNLALRLWGDKAITDAVLKTWLDRLITRNGWLDMGRKKPIPHESFAQVAGYFFYFGHYYAGLCIEQLSAADRPFYQDHLGNLLVGLQEEDGSWWDYTLYSYHKSYGTAFALMALARCRKPEGTVGQR
jgi:hypothetical protein